ADGDFQPARFPKRNLRQLDPNTPKTVPKKRPSLRGSNLTEDDDVKRDDRSDEHETRPRTRTSMFRRPSRLAQQFQSVAEDESEEEEQQQQYESDYEEEEEERRPVVSLETEYVEVPGFRLANKLFIFQPTEEPGFFASTLQSIRDIRIVQLLQPVFRPFQWAASHLLSALLFVLNTFILRPCSWIFDTFIAGPYNWLSEVIAPSKALMILLALGATYLILQKGPTEPPQHLKPTPPINRAAVSPLPEPFPDAPVRKDGWLSNCFWGSSPVAIPSATQYQPGYAMSDVDVGKIHDRIANVERSVQTLQGRVDSEVKDLRKQSQDAADALKAVRALAENKEGNVQEFQRHLKTLEDTVKGLGVSELQEDVQRLATLKSDGTTKNAKEFNEAVRKVESDIEKIHHRFAQVDERVDSIDKRLLLVEERTVPEFVKNKVLEVVNQHVPNLLVAEFGEDGKVEMKPAFWKYLQEKLVHREEYSAGVKGLEAMVRSVGDGLSERIKGLDVVGREEFRKEAEAIRRE
ncbi:hypothetical protein HK097_003374, partial [Rhizophlyctis rosea]